MICSLLFFILHLLIVNFHCVVSANGCRLTKSNHLNLDVLCDCVIFYCVIFCFFGDP
jgi:hypothetical protein